MEKISKTSFISLLLGWYKDNGRNLPWRYNKDPYKILVSELMLQKTDAPKVKNIYDDFFKKFPTIYEIDKTSIKTLERTLEPLGLYRKKAERLKSISKTIIENHYGKIPNSKNELLELNGVGNYIANAVMCFAYNKDESIVDTNVIRLYNRIFNLQSSKKRPRTDKEIWNFAKAILPLNKVQDYNYAVLDYASLICKAKKPNCEVCIFKQYCSF